MGKAPEGVKTVGVEGKDLQSAIDAAAEELGVGSHQVGHTLDLAHFRSVTGTSVARDTVKIIAWVDPDAPEEAPAPKKPKAKAKKADDQEVEAQAEEADTAEEPAEEEAPGEETEASKFAVTWFEGLLAALEVEAKVSGEGTDERVRVRIKPEARAGRLIGRRGSTLAAVRHLLSLALQSYGDFIVDVDVDDPRDEGKSKGRGRDRDDRRAKGRDRDDRKGRGRDRDDRRGRGRDRDDRRGRGRGRDRDEKGSGLSEDKLKALARRAAEKALDTGKTITINLELNSYDRRIVHMEVSEVSGVATRSVERGDRKVVQVVPN